MLLAPVNEIREQLGFDDMTDINSAVTMALSAAEPQLAAVLNTEFDRGVFTDTFYVREPPFRDGPAVETEFRLRRGLVKEVTSVLLCNDPDAFDDPTSTIDVTAKTTLHSSKGIVRDFKTHYMRQYVQITYDAGFDADDAGVYQNVPDWLKNAAKLQAMINMADSPVLSEAQIKLDTKMLSLEMTALLSRHLRYAPMSLLPL